MDTAAKAPNPVVSPPPYRVLARKYRPETFADLIGQAPMVQTLQNAFESDRLAQAWMLTGVRGVGKTTTARILARALNYKTNNIDRPTIALPEKGEHCQAIMEGRHVDVIEMDAASHTGIDDIREIIEQVRYRPVTARYKVYIIDEVHMLSTQAFNGLLKTLEEPPPHVKFIFATTEIRKVPITVLSRCQRFDLRRIESTTLAEHLKKITSLEGSVAEPEALSMIARAAEGSVRDALSILDQAIAASQGYIKAQTTRAMLGLANQARIIDLFAFIMKGDMRSALHELRDQYNNGADPLILLSNLADFNHLVTRLRFINDLAEDASLTEEERQRGLEFSQKLSLSTLSRTWQMLLKGLQEVEKAPRPIQAAEMLIIRLAHAADLPPLEDALNALAAGKSVPPVSKISSTMPTPIKSVSNEQIRTHNPPTVYGVSEESEPDIEDITIDKKHQNIQPTKQNKTPQEKKLFESKRQISTQNACPHTLVDLIALADHHKDIHLKLLIKEYIRPISISPGRLECSLEPGAPRNFCQDLASKLRLWTGQRWDIIRASEGGGKTLREEEDNAHAALLSQAARDPEIDKILKHFPGAKIVDVRLNKNEEEHFLDLSTNTALDNDSLDQTGYFD
ncbi:DNA polymerase III subunit gamma/tau [Bartonella sp. DGB2]|uniref:DNA polymerase III subunit gamma/tau n=1 Tax=Bartonella sp. DGB2 TaxID=3388426 RepID=UPI00398FF120